MSDLRMDFELVKTLMQMGAAGFLMLAGRQFLIYMAQERDDRKIERDLWFKSMDAMSENIQKLAKGIEETVADLRGAISHQCPFTGLDSIGLQRLRHEIFKEK